MAPIHRCSRGQRGLSHHLRRVAVFSVIILIFSGTRITPPWQALEFSSTLIALRPSPAKLEEQPLMTIEFKPYQQNGLGAQVLHLIDAAVLAQFAGHAQLCVVEAHYWNYGCAPSRGWSCYFRIPVCPSPQTTCAELSQLSPRSVWKTQCIRISTRASARRAATLTRRLARDHPISPAAFIRHAAAPLWHFNENSAAHVATIINRMELQPARYIAIHVRRGDKRKEVRLAPLRIYADAIKLLALQDENVFVATDDGRVLSELSDLLPHNRVVALPSAFIRLGHEQIRHNRVWMKHRYFEIIDLLAEVEIMRHSRIFIGTFSSNLARLVHSLRNADERDSISLDDRWAPGVAWRTFGQSYCRWPGSNETFCSLWDVNG